MSCTTSAYFGSPRGFVSCCNTYSGWTVTAEVAGSSPVVPANFFKYLQGIWQSESWSNLVQSGQRFSFVEHHSNKFALCPPLVRHTRLSVKIQRNRFSSNRDFRFDLGRLSASSCVRSATFCSSSSRDFRKSASTRFRSVMSTPVG
jgi:hypothetical protein